MRFVPNQPIETKTPTVLVDPGLAIGSHRFRLEVENAAGVRSAPVDAVVTIVGLVGLTSVPLPTIPPGPVRPSS
jgi:hypothetical protein